MEEELSDFINNGHERYFQNLSIDCVIFGYHDKELKILLAKWKQLDGWGLPGGFIGLEESLATAATRILKDKTSLDNVYLEQFKTFGESEFRLKEKKGMPWLPKDNWLRKRTFGIGYYALVEFSKVAIRTDFFYEDYHWQDVDTVPQLLFDHNEMIEEALRHMRLNLYHKPIGYELLERRFTLPEIQSLYETILGKKLDRRNFPKKLMNLELIKDTSKVRKIGQHRSPKLYEFNKEKYDQALREGIILVL